jgi:hypothetical protein
VNSTVALYLCTAALLFSVIGVEVLTPVRVIQSELYGYERNVGHAANRARLQCRGVAAQDSAAAEEAGA